MSPPLEEDCSPEAPIQCLVVLSCPVRHDQPWLRVVRMCGIAALPDDGLRLAHHLDSGAAAVGVLAQVAPPGAGTGNALVKAEHMAGDAMERHALGQAGLDIGDQPLHDPGTGDRLDVVGEEAPVGVRQNVGIVVGGAAEHDAVDKAEMGLDLVEGQNSSVDDDGQFRPRGLQPVDPAVVERRDFPVLLGRQALEPGLAGMDNEGCAAGFRHQADEIVEGGLAVLVVDADAALDRHRNADRGPHGGDAVGDQPRLGHQAGAEAPGLDPVGRTADIEVDLVIAETLTDGGGPGKLVRVAAAQLQGDRVFRRVEADQPLPVAVDDGGRGDHLGIEQRAGRDEAQEVPVVAIGPVHHRCNGEFSL